MVIGDIMKEEIQNILESIKESLMGAFHNDVILDLVDVLRGKRV
jgi:hypothetical protein